MTDQEFLRLATLYLEEEIDQVDLATLHRELANSPERVTQFNDLRLLTGLIHEHGRSAGSEQVDLTADRDTAASDITRDRAVRDGSDH